MVLFILEMIQANNRLFHTEKNSFIRSATIKLSYILLGVVPCVAWDIFFFLFLTLDFCLSRLTNLQFIQYHVAGFYKPTIPQSPPSHWDFLFKKHINLTYLPILLLFNFNKKKLI